MVRRLEARLGAGRGPVCSRLRCCFPGGPGCLGFPPPPLWRLAASLGSKPPASYCLTFLTL